MKNIKNGNYSYTLCLETGTKTREGSNEYFPEFPETIDVKITNYCDLGCKYCHEKSTVKGGHGDLNTLIDLLTPLKGNYVELAIGGGNPLSHPNLKQFLESLKEMNFVPNLTINQGHLKQYWNLIVSLVENKLIYGIGVSITSNNYKYVKKLLELHEHTVIHVIAGINLIEVLDELNNLVNHEFPTLVLGYKNFGFGTKYQENNKDEVSRSLSSWYRKLGIYLNKYHISFDNLALDQLNVKRFFKEEKWNLYYMGDDFTFSMYIDAVKKEYAPTSRSSFREAFKNNTIVGFFKNHRGNASII